MFLFISKYRNGDTTVLNSEIHKYKTQKQRMANNRNDEKQLIEKMCNTLYCYIPRLPSLIVILFSPSKLYGINRSVNIEKYKSNLWIELVNLEIYITFKLNTAYFSCILKKKLILLPVWNSAVKFDYWTLWKLIQTYNKGE